MSGFDERTPEERERARQEREARRRARAEGRKSPKPPNPPKAPSAPTAPKAAGAPPPRRPSVDLERLRRIAGRRRAESPAAPAAPPPGRPPRGRAFKVFAGLLAVLAVVVLWLVASIFQPFKGDGEGSVRVSIPTGAGVGDIADQLEQRGVVADATFFEARVTLTGHRGDLKPGVYTLRRDMGYGDVIDALAEGPPVDVVTVTVPEGRSRREVAAIVSQSGLEGSYLRATVRSRVLNPRRYRAERARDLEGFLFPATYELKRGASVQRLVTEQLQAFKREFRKIDLRQARRRNLTPYDVLIIASMVEREAMLDKERPVIASVIYNRLRRGEPLGIDATIRFATNNWTEPLTESDLALDSAYNTRTRGGLPPGPIGSPGLESLRAAADPADTDFLFYVVKPGTCGEHDFSRTLEEFERDAARYNRERERRGGRSPTDCP